MARVNEGSYGLACHPHIYPRMERAILLFLHKHSPDGNTTTEITDIWLQVLLIYRSWKDQKA